MRIVEDIEECKALWEKHSPRGFLWDEWDIVFSHFHPGVYRPYFMVFDFGLLPLWFDIPEGKYYLFGGTYPEGRRFWFDIEHFEEVYRSLPVPTKLIDMDGDHVDKLVEKFPFLEGKVESDNAFYIDLKSHNWSLESYLSTYSKKHRYNLLYDIKKSESRGIVKTWGPLRDFEFMVKFNVARFGEESDYFDKEFAEEVRLLFESIDKRGQLIGLYITKDDELVGLEYGAFSHGIYYVLNGGYSLDYPNLGKVIIMEHIKRAIELKADEIDFLTGDTGWKKMWNFSLKKRSTIKKLE